jgi:hypothetical protein
MSPAPKAKPTTVTEYIAAHRLRQAREAHARWMY